jgi:DNA-binding NarL/FixJ family response regulator
VILNKILLVENDNPLCIGLKSMLETGGEYAVERHIATEKEAIQICRQSDPNIVILDLHLPDENGTGTMKK